MEEENIKIKALVKHLGCEPDEVEQSYYDDNMFEYGREEYLVLTDEEADDTAKERIEDSLWAFNTDFLRQFLPEPTQDHAEEILAPLREKCEDANEAIKALVNWDENSSDIVEEAIIWDGRGHFISSYDNEENEVVIDGTYFYIYRIN